MQKIFIFIVIGLVLLGTAVYLNLNSQSRKLIKIDKYSKEISNYPDAKQPEIVELQNGDSYNLTASIVKKKINGAYIKMLAYNGSIPGPLIRVPQNAEITINFKNQTDVETTLHSHGVRLANRFDGVPDITQKPIKPGRTFTYKLNFPDPGVYWYHPHLREDYAQELGLYGNFIVEPANKTYWAEVDREVALFLDDILIQNGALAPFNKAIVNHTLMGRFGNVMLVNGEDNFRLKIKQGERVRFYITNAANTRVFNFSIPNTRMRLVGADNGKYEREEWINSVILGPSERIVVEIWFDKAGDYQIINKTPKKTYVMGTVAVSSSPVTKSYLLVTRVNQDMINSLTVLRSMFTKPADKTLKISLNMMGSDTSDSTTHGMPNDTMMENEDDMHSESDNSEKIEWEDTLGMMNAMSNTKMVQWKLIDDATKKENMDINWLFQKGEKVKIKIINDLSSFHPMQHPIHIHGQRFLVTSINGISNQNLVWKDTVLVKTGDTVELLVDMANPGEWLIHCHIPEHMEAGMTSRFKVTENQL